MNSSNESSINIQLVHGGFIFTSQDDSGFKTEVFTSQGKLMKAIRQVIDSNSLVSPKTKDETKDDSKWAESIAYKTPE